jgi:hypothetical protein
MSDVVKSSCAMIVQRIRVPAHSRNAKASNRILNEPT